MNNAETAPAHVPIEPAKSVPIAPETSTIIQVDKVVKRCGDLTVLDNLDFHVQKGEKVTIIGPSGSGKSTVLRILMTLETIDEGVIHVAGRP